MSAIENSLDSLGKRLGLYIIHVIEGVYNVYYAKHYEKGVDGRWGKN